MLREEIPGKKKKVIIDFILVQKSHSRGQMILLYVTQKGAIKNKMPLQKLEWKGFAWNTYKDSDHCLLICETNFRTFPLKQNKLLVFNADDMLEELKT